MDDPSPAATAEGYDPPPSPEAFPMSVIDGVSLPDIAADGLDEAIDEAIDEVIFGPGEIFFEEGSGFMPDATPVDPLSVPSPHPSSPIAHFASLRPMSVDGLPPPFTVSGYDSPVSPTPTGLPHPVTGPPHRLPLPD